MKHLVMILIVLPCMLSAKALLRETSQLQNRVQAPPDNELVFARSEDGTVSAYVGINGAACQIIDESAVRVARATPFDASEIYIDTTDATTLDVDGRVAYKGTVVCTNIYKDAIGRIEVEQYNLPGAAVPVPNEWQIDIDGCTATITVTGGGPGMFFSAYPAVPDTSVDLTQNDVTLTDGVGTIKFSQLRSDMLDRVSGNLGQDWSHYSAKRSVNLENNTLLFGSASGSALQGSSGQLAFYTGAQPVIVTEASTSGSATSGVIRIEDMAIGTDSVMIAFVATGIPAESMTLQYSPSLSDPAWLAVSGAELTTGDNGCLIYNAPRNPSGKTGFWRIISGVAVSSVVTINGDLNILGGVIMRSPNGSKWRITVTDSGTLAVVGE